MFHWLIIVFSLALKGLNGYTDRNTVLHWLIIIFSLAMKVLNRYRSGNTITLVIYFSTERVKLI